MENVLLPTYLEANSKSYFSNCVIHSLFSHFDIMFSVDLLIVLNLIPVHFCLGQIGVYYGNPEVTSGGIALKFFASVRLEIRPIGKIKSVCPDLY